MEREMQNFPKILAREGELSVQKHPNGIWLKGGQGLKKGGGGSLEGKDIKRAVSLYSEFKESNSSTDERRPSFERGQSPDSHRGRRVQSKRPHPTFGAKGEIHQPQSCGKPKGRTKRAGFKTSEV